MAQGEIISQSQPLIVQNTTHEKNENRERAQAAYDAGDFEKAVSYAQTAGLNGDIESQIFVAQILSSDKLGPPDYVEAAKWYQKAAMRGNATAYMSLGKFALSSQGGLKPADALVWFSKAAQLQRSDAMRAIGDMYMKGIHLPKNIEKAQSWLEQAYNHGDAYAARILADSYFDKQAPIALSWYENAAYLGDYESAYIAAIMLAENLDLRPDPQKQARLLEQAANAQHPAAMADYGLLVYQGANVSQSTDEAAQWFKKSAQAGDPEGQFLYAFTLAKGEGITQSYEEAYYWLLKSGDSEVKAYQKDRDSLKAKLESHVSPDILERARTRFQNESMDRNNLDKGVAVSQNEAINK